MRLECTCNIYAELGVVTQDKMTLRCSELANNMMNGNILCAKCLHALLEPTKVHLNELVQTVLTQEVSELTFFPEILSKLDVL